MAQWVIGFIEQYGYLGIAALMLAENLFPPLPSELIMPFAAFQSARGELNPALVIASGSLGSLVGAWPWYAAGRVLGMDRVLELARRHGRWVTVSAPDIQRAADRFVQHGPIVLVAGRVVPALRTVVALPAGITRIPFGRFCAWTAVGSMLWCAVLTAAGYWLEDQHARVARIMNPVSTAILVIVAVVYAWRVIRFRPQA